MASSGRVNINPEDLRDGDGTLRRGLELWSCRNGPVRNNQWQSVFFALIREHGLTDEEASAERLITFARIAVQNTLVLRIR